MLVRPAIEYVQKAADFLIKNKDLYDSETTGTSGTNCCFGVITNKGVLQEKKWACHSGVSNLSDPAVSFTLLVKNTTEETKEACSAYLDWMLSPDSPWKEAFPKEDFIINHGVNVSSEKFRKEYGLLFWHITELPSNIQQQAFVAIRVAKEWPWLVRVWHTLVTQYGFTREWAYLYVTLWKSQEINSLGLSSQSSHAYTDFFNYDKPYTFSKYNFYDFPIDMITCDEQYIINFINHDMAGIKTPPYATDQKYKPVNAAWGDNCHETLQISNGVSGDKVKTRYVYNLLERYKHLGQNTTTQTTFGGSETRTGFQLGEVIQIGLMEQDRLYKILTKKAA